MRSKYGEYPEYHTSLDDLERVVTPRGLAGSYALYQRMIQVIESDCRPRTRVLGEPQLGRRGLYPSISKKGSTRDVRVMLDLISWADGDHSLLEIAERCKVPVWHCCRFWTTLRRRRTGSRPTAMTPRLGIIVFARMSSARLPGKMLRKLGNRTLLERVIERARCVHRTLSWLPRSVPTTTRSPMRPKARRTGIPRQPGRCHGPGRTGGARTRL